MSGPARQGRRGSGLVHISEILPSVIDDIFDEVIQDWPRWTDLVGPFSAELETAIVASRTEDPEVAA